MYAVVSVLEQLVFSVLTVIGLGQVTTGGTASVTVTVNEHVLVLAGTAASLYVYVTVLTPVGNCAFLLEVVPVTVIGL